MAAAHKVKCLYCGQIFDINKEPFEKPRANRYAHKNCHEKALNGKTQEEKDYEALIEYIKQLFNNNPNPRVWKQLKEYREIKDKEGNHKYSYSGMLKTLIWWYEIRHNEIERANGAIGIIPYIYDDAMKYYFSLYLAHVANEEKDITQLIKKEKEFIIEPPFVEPNPPRLFNLD